MARVRTQRGSLTGRLRAAAGVLEGRLRLYRDAMDAMTDSGGRPLFSGGRLTRPELRRLLAHDESFQAEVLARLPWATEAERDRLTGELERLLPAVLPEEVAAPPALPWGGTGEGGP